MESSKLQSVDLVRDSTHNRSMTSLGQYDGMPIQQFFGIFPCRKAGIDIFHQHIKLVNVKVVDSVLNVGVLFELREGQSNTLAIAVLSQVSLVGKVVHTLKDASVHPKGGFVMAAVRAATVLPLSKSESGQMSSLRI